MRMNIPFSPPDITDEEVKKVVATMKSGWLTTGPQTKEFEREIADYCGTKKAVALNSATACMEMTLRLLGVGPGDEVITCAYTYTASASVIHHVGATIIMVDSEKDSYHIDYTQLSEAITEKTKVIIPIDIAGVMCDYEKIKTILSEKKHMFKPTNELQEAIGRVVVLSDGAHSFGASRSGFKSGSMADFTSFSFHAVKNLTTGEGGAVTWNDIEGIDNESIYKQYMLLSLHGQSKDALEKTSIGAWEYDIVAPNYKCNMTDIMASIGSVQLKRYDKLMAVRVKIISEYNSNLNMNKISILEHNTKNEKSSGHLYLTRVNGVDEGTRNEIIVKMGEAGIATNVHYKPLPMHTAYKNLGFDILDFPNAYAQYSNQITLPLHTSLSLNDVKYICDTYNKIVSEL